MECSNKAKVTIRRFRKPGKDADASTVAIVDFRYGPRPLEIVIGCQLSLAEDGHLVLTTPCCGLSSKQLVEFESLARERFQRQLSKQG